jgi:HD-GYP domain-containing protein (c-di-GMP phosphodiesterase class II)
MVKVVHSGIPRFIEDIKNSSLNLDNPIIKEFKPVSFFIVPVAVRDKVIGVLAADKGAVQSIITQDDRDYLTAFVNQIASAIEQSKLLEKNRKSYLNSIKTLVMALEARDKYTRGHSERVTYYSIELANILGLPEYSIDVIRDIVPLHDIGKLGVPDSLLHKKTSLEKDEMEAIRNHTVVGAQIVSPLHLQKDSLCIVRNHHEWFNGDGYPDGLSAGEIPEVTRIVSVTDAFDAMTTRRPYRAGMSIRYALRQLVDNAGTQFDPSIARAFDEAVRSELVKLPLDIPQL